MRDNGTQPYGTPVMAGGLFSINREYFWFGFCDRLLDECGFAHSAEYGIEPV